MLYSIRCIGLMLAFVSGVVYGQGTSTAYPTRPVTIIIPFPPGASTDMDGRQWGQKLGEALGTRFVLDFKPGGGGVIGMNYVAKAAPDGYVLMIVSGSLTVQGATRADLPFDPIKDFTPISLMNRRIAALLVHSSLPVHTFPEYVAYAKARPGALNMGTNGPGAIIHLAGAWLNSSAGITTTFVHYKGTAPMFQDFVAGRVQVATGTIPTSAPFVKAGKIRPIALLGRDRSDLLPGLRTVAEHGLADYDYSTWTGLFGPAGMSPVVVDKLASEMSQIAKSSELKASYAQDGTVAVGSSPAELRRFVISELNKMKQVAQEFSIKAVDD